VTAVVTSDTREWGHRYAAADRLADTARERDQRRAGDGEERHTITGNPRNTACDNFHKRLGGGPEAAR